MLLSHRFAKPARAARTGPSEAHVGLIGCGKFAFANIAYYLKKNYGRVIRAAMDVDINKAASLFEKYHLDYYTADASEIIHAACCSR